jgi:alcohol dehydrogenase class IV
MKMTDAAPAPFAINQATRRILFGWDSLAQLPELAREAGARRALVVLDGFFLGSALQARLESLLRPALSASPAFHGAPAGEPTVASALACRDALTAAAPELVIAIGGGSAMDTAKMGRAFAANPAAPESLAGPGKTLHAHASRLVCVPTTAGTGSEVSEAAVLDQAASASKLVFLSDTLAPHTALLDPALTVSAPQSVTAYAGYDALTHAVEAYVSRRANPVSDGFALAALTQLARWLPVAWREPGHRAARSHCLIAATQAALAFNSALLGLAHAISNPLGALHHIPHGLGNALALPAVAAFNEPVLGDKGTAIAGALGTASPSEGLARLRHAIGLDRGLDEFLRSDLERAALAEAALKSVQVKINPRLAGPAEMAAIIEAMRRPIGGARPPLAI